MNHWNDWYTSCSIEGAIKNGNLELLGNWLREKEFLSCSIFVKAIEHGHLHIVKFLVDKYNIKIHYFDDSNLRIAAANGWYDIVEYFIEMIPKPYKKGNGMLSTLSSASENGHFDVVKLLVEKGGVDDFATSFALEQGHFEIAIYLIENGAEYETLNWFKLGLQNPKSKNEAILMLRMLTINNR